MFIIINRWKLGWKHLFFPFRFFFWHGGEGDTERVEGIDKGESGLFICTATGVDCRRLEVCSHHARCRQGWKTTPSRNVGLLLFAWSWRLRPIFCGHVLPNCHSHATRQICAAHGQEHEDHCQQRYLYININIFLCHMRVLCECMCVCVYACMRACMKV